MNETNKQKLASIELLVMDCDGVMTNGELILRGSEEPAVFFHVRDGLAIRMLHKQGIKTAVLSGRKNEAIRVRGEVLGMLEVVDDRLDKAVALQEMLARHAIKPEQVAFVGDDLPDIGAFNVAHVSFCPADAAAEVQEAADYVTKAVGGHGVIREIAEMILMAKDLWNNVLAIHTTAD